MGIQTASQSLTNENIGPFGFRNIVINGDMRIAQRNTSATGIGTSSPNTFPTVDRLKFFSIGTNNAVWTATQSTDAPNGFSYSAKYECTTADASPSTDCRHQLAHVFEGQSLQHLKWGTSEAKPVTVSFWIKATRTGTQNVFLYQYNINSGNGGHITRQVTINQANTWEYKTITFAGNTAAAITNTINAGLQITFPIYLGTTYTNGTFQDNVWRGWDASSYNDMTNQVNHASAVGNTFQITGLQMEVGSVATPFEYRPVQMELALCQRYCYVISQANNGSYDGYTVIAAGNASTVSNVYVYISLPVSMRVPPTVTRVGTSSTPLVWTTSAGTVTGLAINELYGWTNDRGRIRCDKSSAFTAGASGNLWFDGSLGTLDNKYIWSAEL